MKLSTIVSTASEARHGGVALSSLLLAAPVLLVARAGAGAILFAVSFVAVAAVLEGRTRVGARRRELTGSGLSLVAAPPRSRAAPVVPRATWELVERDGQRSLSMRWR